MPFTKVTTVRPTELPPYCAAEKDLARRSIASCTQGTAGRLKYGKTRWEAATLWRKQGTKRLECSTRFKAA